MLVVLLLGALVVVGVGAFAYASVSLPSPSKTATAATTKVLYKDGSVLGQLSGSVNRVPLTSEQMPKIMKQAAVASEDRTFYTNRGISPKGIARAVYGVLTRSDLGGGSTITQQYVKNISGNDDHTYTRKAREAVQALKIDQQLSKDEILTRYLNTIYFGRRSYGVGTAAQAYFGLSDPSQLTPEQAAVLIGIIPSPNNWDPAKDPTDAQARYTYVMKAMVATGAISQAEADAHPTMPPTVNETPPQWFSGPNGYILATVQKEAATDLHMDPSAVANAGLTITTTIDPGLQDAAVKTMGDPKAYPTRGRTASVRAGLVSIDPATGGVVAMYGGPNYLDPAVQYDAINQARSQAGSTFKPFALVAGLEDGISLNSTWNGQDGLVLPGYPKGAHNFSNETFGRINLLTATEESVNTVFLQLNQKVGPEATAAVAKKLGVTISDADAHNLSNVLGTATVSPLQMASAYATFAAGGVYRTPHYVASVSRAGKVAFAPDTAGQQVIDPAVNASTVYALQQVVKSGTAASAGKALGKRPAAGKTGTVSDNKAAWFNGFTPQLETAVVMYNSDPKTNAQLDLPRINGREVTGGTVPTTIWSSFMSKALKGAPVQAFPPPPRSVSTATPSTSSTATSTATATDSPTSSSTPTSTSTDGSTSSPTDDATSSSTSSPSDSSSDGGDGSGSSGNGNGKSGRPTGRPTAGNG